MLVYYLCSRDKHVICAWCSNEVQQCDYLCINIYITLYFIFVQEKIKSGSVVGLFRSMVVRIGWCGRVS